MKKLSVIVLGLVSFLTLPSCSSDKDHHYITIDGSSQTRVMEFDSKGTAQTVSLISTLDWSVTRDWWVNVTPGIGKGGADEQQVVISLTPNTGAERSSYMIFRMSNGDNVSIKVVQSSGYTVMPVTGNNIRAAALSPNGQYLAGVGEDAYYVWDLKSFSSNPRKVNGVTLSNDPVWVSDGGQLFKKGITPDGNAIAETVTETDGFLIPAIRRNGTLEYLSYNEKDVFGNDRGEGYLGNAALAISENGVVVTGYQESAQLSLMACVWVENSWGNWVHRVIRDANGGYYLPATKAISPNGKYVALNGNVGNNNPAIYDVENDELSVLNQLSGRILTHVTDDRTIFHAAVMEGALYYTDPAVYSGSSSLSLREWILQNYDVDISNIISGASYVQFVGATAKRDLLVWSCLIGSEWNNYVLRPNEN